MFLLPLIVLSLIHLIAANPVNIKLEPFQLEEFLNGAIKNKGWNGTWISDDTFIIKTENGDINKVNAATLQQEQFLPASVFSNYNGSSFQLSADQENVLIAYNTNLVFRHSKTSQYAVYNIETKEYYDIALKRHIQYATWSPVGSSLTYIIDNNIYYAPHPGSNPIQITFDGVPGIIYNGVPDWVYEEEVLGNGRALWFSPDGRQLAFASFNDTNVKEFQYYNYGNPGSIDNQYPGLVKLRYPKVGTPNPVVVVKHVDLEDPNKVIKTISEMIPKQIVTEDYVVVGVTWASNTDVVALVENRVQNIGVITRCSIVEDNCHVEQELRESKGWLQIKPPKYNKDGTKSILITSQEEGDDTYQHLVLYNSHDKEIKRLTKGKRVVLAILGWDEDKDLVYYASTIEEHPSQTQTFVININTLEEQCLTSNFRTSEGLCNFSATHLSKNFSYFTKVCTGPGPTLVQIENLRTRQFKIWEENVVLQEQLANKIRPVIMDINVPLESGFTARARLSLPPDYETSGSKYPMIVDVYGGPNSNKILDTFATGIVNYFTTNREYIYLQIDGRGSGRNGNNLMFQVYRRLGSVEIEDQIAVTKYLIDNYKFIDSEKVGIWGWSYGGFATLWALIRDTENVFKCGLSVAPVTNFILYDTIYTERYMGLPTENDNLLGYNNTDVTHHLEHFKDKTLFIIHGNADDNVHYQQAMYMVKALEQADIMFYQHSYPDENHSLKGVLPHLYHTIDNFFAQQFQNS